MIFYLAFKLKKYSIALMKRSSVINLLLANFGVFLIIGMSMSSKAHPLGSWQWRNPLPQGNALFDVKFLDGGFIAVGDFGAILTSSNGIQWSQQTSGTTRALYSVTFGSGEYVIGGANGVVLTSNNGTNWASWSSGSTNSITAIAYGGGVFAAGDSAPVSTGNNSRFGFLYSTNGTDWVRSIPPTNAPVHGMTYGNGLFAAVDGIDGGYVWTSPDGLNWSHPGGGMQFNAITYGDGYFVAVGADYYGLPGAIITSHDGVTWTHQSSGVYQMLDGVTDAGGTFEVIGANGTFLYSDDTVNWYTNPPLPTPFNLHALTYGNGTVVAVGNSGTIVASTNTGWTNRITRNSFTLGGVAYGANQFVAVGTNGTILGSTDGVIWTNRNSGVSYDNLSDVIFNNGLFVVVGDFGLLTSTNGINWSVSTNNLYASKICFGNGSYVAVEGWKAYNILISSDGTTWTQVSTYPNRYFDITFGNGLFLAVAQNGGMATSTTGTNWTPVTSTFASPPYFYAQNVACSNGQFVAVGSGIGIETSRDAVNWGWGIFPAQQSAFNCLSYGNGLFLATAGSSLLSSPDGTNWTQWSLGADATVNGMAYGAGTFVAVGNGGAILQSGDFRVPWMSGTVDVSNRFDLSIGAELGRAYRLQTSPDLQTWTDWVIFTNSQYPTCFSDPAPGTQPQRFYRITSP